MGLKMVNGGAEQEMREILFTKPFPCWVRHSLRWLSWQQFQCVENQIRSPVDSAETAVKVAIAAKARQ